MKSRMSVIAIVLLVSMLLANCAPAATPTPTAAPVVETEVATAAPTYPPAPECISIGASIPLTGKFGSLGTQVESGYKYAIADINAAGGVYVAEYGTKIPLCLTDYDDESDPTKAVNNLEKIFSENDPVAFLGGAASGMHAATTAIAEKDKVPYLGVSFAWWNIHQKGYKYLFSPFPKSPDQARDIYQAMNDLIPADQKPTKIAVFQEKSDWGNEEGGLLKSMATSASGYSIVYYGEYAIGNTDFSSMIAEAEAAGAEALFGMPTTGDGVTMVKAIAESSWKPKLIMLNRAPDAATWGETTGAAGNGVVFFAGWHHSETYPGDAELNAKVVADTGKDADVLIGPAYACVQILAAAIEKAGTLDREAVRDAIAATDMTTVIGPVTFNADGTGNVLNPLTQWQDGKSELVWPADMKTADLLYPLQ